MTIKNYNYIIPSENFDIIHREKIYLNDAIVQSSELLFHHNRTTTRIKFELAKNNSIQESDFLFIPETNFLFYRGTIEWCAFDLTKKCVARNENATQLPHIERRKNVVLIFDDLYAECTDLKAQRIDYVPIDPPTETVEFDEKIEFNSAVFGKQTLKLTK